MPSLCKSLAKKKNIISTEFEEEGSFVNELLKIEAIPEEN